MKYALFNLRTKKFVKNPHDKSKNNTLVFEYPIQALKWAAKYFGDDKNIVLRCLT